MKRLVVIVICAVLLSCDNQRYHEDFIDFEAPYWLEGQPVEFAFDVEDASQPYHVYATFRNTQQYPYHNFYFEYTLRDSEGVILSQSQEEAFFFDATTGEPLGDGLGDYFDQQSKVLDAYNFPSAGSYAMELRQMMRLDTLPFISSAGIRIEFVEGQD